MNARRPLAWSAAAASLVLTLVGTVFLIVNWGQPAAVAEWGFPGFQAVAVVDFVLVGLVIALRRENNPIGWLLLVAGVLSAIQFAGHGYSVYGLHTAPGSVPLASVGTWTEEWIWMGILTAAGTFTFLLFPTGRLLSARWRAVAWLALAGTIVGSHGGALVPTTRVPGAVNPIVGHSTPWFAEVLHSLGIVVVVGVLAAGGASVLIRFRRAAGVERQQMKWLAFGALLVAVTGIAYSTVTVVVGDDNNPAAALLGLATLFVPVAIALAVLRHGLYEIDRVLNRTVVYSAVSVVLVSLYAGSVLLLQGVLASVTSGDTLAVAASTLLVAAIFQPVRGRIQSAVDRRFFRSRYDAQLSAERLGARLREEVDVDAVGRVLVAEVVAVVNPQHATVWLRRR